MPEKVLLQEKEIFEKRRKYGYYKNNLPGTCARCKKCLR